MFKAESRRIGICPKCEEERTIETGTQPESWLVKGISFSIVAHVKKCTTCQEVFATTAQEEINVQALYHQHEEFLKNENRGKPNISSQQARQEMSDLL